MLQDINKELCASIPTESMVESSTNVLPIPLIIDSEFKEKNINTMEERQVINTNIFEASTSYTSPPQQRSQLKEEFQSNELESINVNINDNTIKPTDSPSTNQNGFA